VGSRHIQTAAFKPVTWWVLCLVNSLLEPTRYRVVVLTSWVRNYKGNLKSRKPMALIDGMLQELDEEARTTRRVLERVPDNQLAWRPHEKARTLGELALHVAMVPGAVAELIASQSPAQVPTFTDPSPKSASELIPTLDQSIAKAKEVLGGVDDAALMATWRLMQGEREIFAVPRVALLRSIMLNHWYHHRGQLTVYLRELDVPIPSIYGPSADENPFA
jgi:uncharacterized damage-inducible protein DinB